MKGILTTMVLAIGVSGLASGETAGQLMARAQNRDVAAMRTLGIRMFKGGYDGIPTNRKTGLLWLKKAAAKNDAAALLFLGDIYAEGRHVPLDTAKAVDYYRRAKENGSINAKDRLAKLGVKEEKKEEKNVNPASKVRSAAAVADAKKVVNEPKKDYEVGISRNEEGKKPLLFNRYVKSFSGKCEKDEYFVTAEDGRRFDIVQIMKLEDLGEAQAREKQRKSTSIEASKKWEMIANYMATHDFSADPIYLCKCVASIIAGNDNMAMRVKPYRIDRLIGLADPDFLNIPEVSKILTDCIDFLQNSD